MYIFHTSICVYMCVGVCICCVMKNRLCFATKVAGFSPLVAHQLRQNMFRYVSVHMCKQLLQEHPLHVQSPFALPDVCRSATIYLFNFFGILHSHFDILHCAIQTNLIAAVPIYVCIYVLYMYMQNDIVCSKRRLSCQVCICRLLLLLLL